MATKLKSYSTTPGSNNSAAPNGFPEGMLPSAVNNAAREMMARLAEWYADAEWILRNDAITAYTGSTITITGDVTAKYTANRAIRLDENASRVGIITGSSYSAPSTTVTITGYTIAALPTSVEIGIIDSTKVGLVQIAGSQTITGDKTFSGTTTFTGAATLASVAGGAVATQAEQEAGTAADRIVTPGRQHHHPSAAKAWVRFNGSTAAIAASYNVSGVVRNSAGRYTISFTTPFSSTNYCAVPSAGPDAATTDSVVAWAHTYATGSVQVCVSHNDTVSIVNADRALVTVIVYGDQ